MTFWTGTKASNVWKFTQESLYPASVLECNIASPTLASFSKWSLLANIEHYISYMTVEHLKLVKSFHGKCRESGFRKSKSETDRREEINVQQSVPLRCFRVTEPRIKPKVLRTYYICNRTQLWRIKLQIRKIYKFLTCYRSNSVLLCGIKIVITRIMIGRTGSNL